MGSLEYVNHTFLKENKLKKRKYQLDIFITCSKSNCLVVVPTGLGKTIIALLLSIQRLKKSDSKIIFLAPTRPLVEQHLQTFKDLTNIDEESLLMMTGSQNPEKRIFNYNKENIKCFFMTPQVLQNDLISNRIDLGKVSLLIFDEAHRATGNYAYTFIAKKYMYQAEDPKILAMTASPGKNKEKIEEIMQNLYINAIEVRTDSDSDVKPYIQDVELIWKNVDLPIEMREIINLFEEMHKKIYSELKLNKILESANIREISRKNLLSAGNLLDNMIIKAQQTQDLPRLLFCKKLLANAIRISHMSELIESQGIFALKKYLDKNIKNLSDGKGGKSLQELFSSNQMGLIIEKVHNLISGNIDHPKISLLMNELMEQFKTNLDSRILVFCHFRDTVKNIVSEINKNQLIKAQHFVGQQSKGKDKGLTQKDQMLILEQFKNGIFNTLVATSVAEEGLDISECDVVIFYDVVPSEIRTIQRRGRTGRNSAGKVIIFKTVGTREEGYFWAGKNREKKMKQVLNEMKQSLTIQKKKKEKKDLFSYINEDPKKKLEKKKKNKQNPRENNSHSQSNENLSIKDTTLKIKSNEVDIEVSPDLSTDNPYIIADSRETASSVCRKLSEMHANLSLEKNPVGDYIISERCGIERKSIDDFINSIKDGRLFNELHRLKAQFSIPVLILEGNINSIITISRKAVLGTLTSILLNMQIFIYQTSSEGETAEIIFALAKKEQLKKNRKVFSIQFKKISENIPQQLEYIISGIPGINISRAQELLKEFHTLKNLLNAEEDAIKKTKNIGPSIAQNIIKYANSDYKTSKIIESNNNDT